MTGSIAEVDPRGVHTPAEFVDRLRRVRERSGLSYREIARRARLEGRTLPPSTLATMLSRTTLPREDLVVALLAACGGEPEAIAEWAAVRRDLAAQRPPASAGPPAPAESQASAVDPGLAESPGDPDPVAPAGRSHPTSPAGDPEPLRLARLAVDPGHSAPAADPAPTAEPEAAAPGATPVADPDPVRPGPAEPTNPDAPPPDQAESGDPEPAPPAPRGARRRRTNVLLALAAVVVAIVAASVVVVWTGDRPPSNPAVDLPAPGAYRFRLVHSNLCLSERPDGEEGYVYQAPCESAMPDRALVALTADVYRIATYHPVYKDGCAGINAKSREVSAPLEDDYCTEPDAQDFQLEAVSDPAGFRIRALHSGLCLGVPSAATAAWQPVLQLACDPRNRGQVFAFDPHPWSARAPEPAGQEPTSQAASPRKS